ncbi:ComEC/Rec2 family competence protein [Microbacterium hominis]|nr:ComEC/Rec2 family competence protein [Microbacterium hominis]
MTPVAAAAWLSAGVATALPHAAPIIAVATWLAAAACLLVVALRTPTRAGARSGMLAGVVVMVSLAAAAAAASHVALASPVREALALHAGEGARAVTVVATVVGKVERRADGSLAFDARAESVTVGAASRAVGAEIVVRVDPDDVVGGADLEVGAVVEAAGTARTGSPGERAVIVVWASRGVSVIRVPQGAVATAAALRAGLRASAAGLPQPGAGLLAGLAVGDTADVDPALDEAMKASSLSHLTAVSGANCALVVALAFLATAACGAGRTVRVVVASAALAGFVVLVTPEPSVVRAAAMAATGMIGVLIGRTGAGMSLLTTAVAVLLIADPWLAGSLGFALSVAATASLLLFARPLAEGLGRLLPRALALAISVPLAAQLACGPLLVLIAPTVPVYGVAANMIAAPAAPVVTVVGLLACLSGPFAWLQDGLTALAWVPAAWIAATATVTADLPGGTLPWLEGWGGAVFLGAVGAGIGVLVGLRATTRGRRAARGVLGAVLAGVLGVALGAGALHGWAGRLALPRDWVVLACDVGQGDAVLVRSEDAIMLVDTGPDPAALDACLARAGIARIDLLVLTHFDLDHIGGVDAAHGRVREVIHGPPDEAGAQTLARLREAGAHTTEVSAGAQGGLAGARWRVLWPRAGDRAFPPGNDASLVLDVRGGELPPILLLGDLSASPQRALAATAAGIAPPYALVKVAHHGSADQAAALYEEAAPAAALVTVGADNRYGHPRAEALAILQQAGASIARTDRDGAVAYSRDGGVLRVWREHAAADGVGGAG